MFGSVKKVCLGLCLASVAVSSYAAPRTNAVAMEANGIPTSVLSIITGVNLGQVVNQITFPTVFVGPVFEGWFSTIRVCYDGVGIALPPPLSDLPLSPNAPATIDLITDGGTVVRSFSIPGGINSGSCKTYTSDIPTDELFGGVPLGVYKVTVTNPSVVLPLLNLGSLNGTVNSTGRDVIAHPLSEFIAKGKEAQRKAGY